MRAAAAVLVGVQLLAALVAAASAGSSNATHPPLFSSSPPTLPTLHTSLASLLPVLPHLAPPPEHTLLVTLATPAFKPLLLNWLCFLRYKARWAAPPSHSAHGEPYELTQSERDHADVPKVLVVTSDDELAHELSDHGVVTWLVRGTDWAEVERADALDDDDPEKDLALMAVEQMLENDIFANLRLLDLLLPPDDPAVPNADGSTVIPWGTLRYQSLMLERTAVMSSLIGALVHTQRSDPESRKDDAREVLRRMMEHDWEEGPFHAEEFKGVKGVLLVDNDAVWLSNPNSFLSHYYRPTGPHPSIVYAPDMSPRTRNAWGTHTMPCACFFYSRVSDDGAQTAAPVFTPTGEPQDPFLYSPAAGAAEVWRNAALCHISMLTEALETGRKMLHAVSPATSPLGEPQVVLGGVQRPGARAPSFQATALGPAVFLAEQAGALLPETSHERFMAALGSGDVEDLLFLLQDAELDLDPSTGKPAPGKSCLALAQTQGQHVCAAQWASTDLAGFSTSLTRTYLADVLRAPLPHQPVRTEALPFDAFPPGMRFFNGGGMEPGARACVVHANYATGGKKAQLLRENGLWALVEPDGSPGGDGQYRCDAGIMDRA
ncbi:uncharacterized protein JCM10292_006553 [Rhodotorula paludigena]|uniref:uncharacterized protein n=1 Tax=Rhodotorula paludigena TaxID=86838 RepID=UPI00317A352C